MGMTYKCINLIQFCWCSCWQAEAHTSDADPGRADDRVKGSKDDIFGQQKKSSRGITEEGYAIYGEDELKLNSTGGDTPLCPFDCDCCF